MSNACLPLSPCQRRPSGLDTEFFLQLFLVPSEEKKKWTVKEMLHKSLVEQNITFAEVCALHEFPLINKSIVYIGVGMICLFNATGNATYPIVYDLGLRMYLCMVVQGYGLIFNVHLFIHTNVWKWDLRTYVRTWPATPTLWCWGWPLHSQSA